MGWHEFWLAVLDHCKAYKDTYEVVGALATAAALITSLVFSWLSHRTSKPLLKCEATLDHGAAGPSQLVVHVSNVGARPVWVDHGAWWKLPFSRLPHITNTSIEEILRLPVVEGPLLPGERRVIEGGDLESLRPVYESSKRILLGCLRRRWIKVVIYTATGEEFSCKIWPGLRGEMLKRIDEY